MKVKVSRFNLLSEFATRPLSEVYFDNWYLSQLAKKANQEMSRTLRFYN